MTKPELDLLLNHEELFPLFFEGIANTYANKKKYYSEALPIIDYNKPFQNLPDTLYKYIDLQGGLQSIEFSNIQFSDPVSFWKHEQLSDKTEFWFERLYFDNKSLEDVYNYNISGKPIFRELDAKNIFITLLHRHTLNLANRNKVLCLAKSSTNQELWNDYSAGICIEYNTNLFKDNDLKFAKNKKYELIGNPVLYVEEIIKYPTRENDDSWLSNLLFVKNQDPFIRENEYRIICTDTNYDPFKDIPIQSDRFFQIKQFLDRKGRENLPIRPTFDRNYINKVYYKSHINNEGQLLEKLRRYDIPWEKID